MRNKIVVILLFLFSLGHVMSQTGIAEHPRILLKAGEEELIHKLIEKDSRMRSVHQYILNNADKTLEESPVIRKKTGKRLLAVSREALKRIYYLSYAFRMTGDKRYAERAEKELLSVCEFSDWNPSHYLDVGEMTMAVAIGYDWLFNYLKESTRKKIRTAIVDKAFETAEIGGFYNRNNNWNQVCNAGLVLGALAIYEDEKEKADYIIKKAVETVPLAMDSYLPDGAYPEGFSYWGYGTGFELMMLAAMESAIDTDFGLSKHFGFMRSPYFMLYMTAPSGYCYNFSDSGKKIGLNQGLFWFAAKTNDPSLVWYEYSYLKRLKSYIGSDDDRLLPNILIFSKKMNFNDMKAPKGNFWFSRGVKPLFIYKGGWERNDDAYLGIVGGSASSPHGHMDAGSFIYEKNGIRWAIDLGLQSYYTLESKGVDLWNKSQNGQRWEVFRLGNMAHSTITINGEKHLVSGYVPIVETYQDENCKGSKLDMSSLYGNNIKQVLRKINLDCKDNLFISDYIETNEKPAEVMWVMVTSAEAKVLNDNEILLNKGGRTMLMSVDCPINKELKIWDNKPVHYYDHDNPGTLRVGFIINVNPNNKINIKVKLEDCNIVY